MFGRGSVCFGLGLGSCSVGGRLECVSCFLLWVDLVVFFGVFGFVSCCGGLCVFGGDSSLDGKFEGCWVFVLGLLFYWGGR